MNADAKWWFRYQTAERQGEPLYVSADELAELEPTEGAADTVLTVGRIGAFFGVPIVVDAARAAVQEAMVPAWFRTLVAHPDDADALVDRLERERVWGMRVRTSPIAEKGRWLICDDDRLERIINRERTYFAFSGR